MKILLATEIGANLGHIGVLGPLSRKLKSDGHDIWAAIPELSQAQDFIGEEISLLQAPVWQLKPRPMQKVASSYAGILAACGYLSVEGLTSLLRAWRSLYQQIKPDLVVAESSPTALLAARGLPIETVRLGTGFSSPPVMDSFPLLVENDSKSKDNLSVLEEKMLGNANNALAAVHAPPIDRLPEVFEADDDIVMSLPQLDPYRKYRAGSAYQRPVTHTGINNPISWKTKADYKVYVYLRANFPGLKNLFEALKDDALTTIAVVPGADKKLMEQLKHPNIALSERPVNLRSIQDHCDLAVSHGGHGVTPLFFSAGTRQLFCPQNLEQLTTAQRVCSMNAGELMADNGSQEQYHRCVLRALRRSPGIQLPKSLQSLDHNACIEALCTRICRVKRSY